MAISILAICRCGSCLGKGKKEKKNGYVQDKTFDIEISDDGKTAV